MSGYSFSSYLYTSDFNPIRGDGFYGPTDDDYSPQMYARQERNLSRSAKVHSSSTDQGQKSHTHVSDNCDSTLWNRERRARNTSAPYSHRKADQQGSQIKLQSHTIDSHGVEVRDAGNYPLLYKEDSMSHKTIGTDTHFRKKCDSYSRKSEHMSNGRSSPVSSTYGYESRETSKNNAFSSRTYTYADQKQKINTNSKISGSQVKYSNANLPPVDGERLEAYKSAVRYLNTQSGQEEERNRRLKLSFGTNAHDNIDITKCSDNIYGNESYECKTYRDNAKHEPNAHNDVRSDNVSDNLRDTIILDSRTKHSNTVKQHSSGVSDMINYSSREQQQQNTSDFIKRKPQAYVNDKTSNVSSEENNISVEKQKHHLTTEKNIQKWLLRQREEKSVESRTTLKSPDCSEKHQQQINSTRNVGSPETYRDDECSSSTSEYRRTSKEKERYKKMADDRPVNVKYTSDKEKDKEIEELKKTNNRLQQEKKEIERRTNELTKQLSRQMKNSNHFENCDDDFSTSKIADRFKLLYDKKWVHLCKWMMQTFRQIPEVKIIQCLSLLIKSCYKECLNMADNQVRQFLLLNESDDIPMYEKHPELFGLRKQYAQTDILRLQVKNIVKDKVHVEKALFEHCQESKTHGLLDRVETFLDEYIDCCWLMTVSRPKMSLNFNVVGKMYSECADQFSVLSLKRHIDDPTKTAGTVYEVVWPSVHLKFESELYTKGDVIVITKKTKDAFSQT